MFRNQSQWQNGTERRTSSFAPQGLAFWLSLLSAKESFTVSILEKGLRSDCPNLRNISPTLSFYHPLHSAGCTTYIKGTVTRNSLGFGLVLAGSLKFSPYDGCYSSALPSKGLRSLCSWAFYEPLTPLIDLHYDTPGSGLEHLFLDVGPVECYRHILGWARIYGKLSTPFIASLEVWQGLCVS